MDKLQPFAQSVLDAFSKKNQRKLRKLNDAILKESVMNFTIPLYELAVLSYVLSKIVSKPRYISKENEPRMDEITRNLQDIVKNIDLPEKKILIKFKKIDETIFSMEKRDARFLRDLTSKGRLKAAATLYAQGLSLGTASEMTGMNKQDILDYAGRTLMFDRIKEEKTIHERMKLARTLIGG